MDGEICLEDTTGASGSSPESIHGHDLELRMRVEIDRNRIENRIRPDKITHSKHFNLLFIV